MVENEGCRMALSPSEAPVYGGSTIVAAFAEDSPLPEGCDFFLIFRGSQQRHITIARQLNAFTLQAVIPDHDCAEVVEVSVCASDIAHHQIIACSLFQYLHDKTWDMARYLADNVTNQESLDSPNAPHVQFDLVGEDVDSFDIGLTSAFESMNLPPWWNVLGTTTEEEDPQPRETLLHFAARLGLRRLAGFLVEKPGAETAIKLANKDGDLPTDLAKKTGHDELAALLADPDSYLSTSPVPRVWETREVLHDSPGKGEAAMLKRHSLGSATLSTQLSTEAEARTLDDDIAVLKHLDMWIGQKSPMPEPELGSPPTSVREDQDSWEDQEAAETAHWTRVMVQSGPATRYTNGSLFCKGDEHSEADFLEESASDTDPFTELPAAGPDDAGTAAGIPTISVTQPTPERDGDGHAKILDENLRRLHNINEGIQRLREMNKKQFIVEEVRKENLSRLSCSCPDLAEGASSRQAQLKKDATRCTSESSMFPVKEGPEESAGMDTDMFPRVGSQEPLADLRIEEERDREVLGWVEEDGKMTIEGVTEDSTNVDNISADKDSEDEDYDIETIQLDAVVMPTAPLEDGDDGEEEKRGEGEEDGEEEVSASRPSQSPRRHSWGPISPIQMSEEDKMATMLKSHSMNHLDHEADHVDSDEEFHDAKEVITPNLPVTPAYDAARTPSPLIPSPGGEGEEGVDPTAASPESDISESGTLLSETSTETGSTVSPLHHPSPHHVKSSSAGSLGDLGIDIKEAIVELDEDETLKKRSMSMSPVQLEKEMLSSPGLTKAVSTSALQHAYMDDQPEFKKPEVPPVMHPRSQHPFARPIIEEKRSLTLQEFLQEFELQKDSGKDAGEEEDEDGDDSEDEDEKLNRLLDQSSFKRKARVSLTELIKDTPKTTVQVKHGSPPAVPRSHMKRRCSLPAVFTNRDSGFYDTSPSNFESDEESSQRGKPVPGGVASLKADDKEKSVRRRFSFIFSSTRLKGKSKGKDKESANTHQFVNISFSNSTVCDICAKTLANKPALQCQNCSINVHESNCQSSVTPCPKAGKSKKNLPSKPSNTGLPPPYPYSGGKERPRSEIIQGNKRYAGHPNPAGMVRGYGHGNTMSSKPAFQTPINSKPISEEDQDTDMAGSRMGRPASHGGSITNIHATISASLESLDEGAAGVDELQEDAELLFKGMEPETWRETIDNKTLRKLKLSERDIKRQNAIYEFMRTEMQHFKTLKIMQRIFAYGMLFELRMDPTVVDQIFPALDDIIDLHTTFKQNLQDRRKEQSPVVEKIGDVICQQFQDELGERMTLAYGELCSKQAEAISIYKEWYTRDRKFQNFIKKCSHIPLCRRFGVPEHIRLVSQRITQYPLVIDAIIKRTKESKPDHEPLKQSRQLVVDLLNRVDEMVDDYNRQQKLLEIYNKLEKGHATFKNGRKFRRDDLLHNHRKLIHEGVVGWKNARGTVKEVTAVVLSDMLLFLHENNQRYSFYSQDQKSAVIPLFKLLVREVANEERSLFLISANTVEMYEIMCVDGKERETWMKIVREAVNNCPEEEDEGMKSETEEERKITEARTAKMNQLIDEMTNRDREVNHHLQEKMKALAGLTELIGREDIAQQLKPTYPMAIDTGEELQAKKWLQAAIQEAENLKNTLYGPGGHLSRSVSSVGEHGSGSHLSPVLPKRNKTFGGFDTKEESTNGGRGSFKKRYPVSTLNDAEQQSSSSPDLPSRVGGASGDRQQLSHSKSDSVSPTEQEHRSFKLSLALLQAFSLIPLRPILSLPPKVGLDRRGSSGSRKVHMEEDGQQTSSEHSSQGDISGRGSPPPYSLVPPSSDHISSVTNLIDYLCRLQSTISQQDTALERYKVQLLEANERISKYQQVQEKESKRSVEKQLEELRQLQDQLSRERHQWEKQKKRKERELQKEVESLEEERSEFQREREHFRVNAHHHHHSTRDMGNSGSQGQYRSVSSASYGEEDIWIVRTTGEGSDNDGSSSSAFYPSPVSDSGLSNETPPGTLERHSSTASLSRKTSSKHIHEVPPHLMSATNQEAIRQRPKSPPFKQQLPLKLASHSNLQQPLVTNNNVRPQSVSPGQQQMIPKKLSNNSGSSLHSGGSGSSLHSTGSSQTSPNRGPSQRNSPPGSTQRHSPPQEQQQQVIPGKLVSSTTVVAHSRTHSLPAYSHYDQHSPPPHNNNEEPPVTTPTSPEQKVIYF
ncbi:A-kinase anchor protein 13-like isoform X6 [Branchiostoma floridae]|uniref:A-kinase anchor protein 13-like isoform X6 n=1 Tax=Branchiostoma floridae TaxID=7739 RepID=A0A9J7KNN7_BRAFL|nr:A-kinase anchor protein 13-like isoform X6 [Branchiostoma floridae]